MNIGRLLAQLLNGNTRHCFLDRAKREDCLSANVTIVIGAANIAAITPVFLKLIEPMEGESAIINVSADQHLYELWDLMEARGLRWVFVPLMLRQNLTAFMFLFCGDDACAHVEEALKAFGVPLDCLENMQIMQNDLHRKATA
jgi:hypothetical protein